MISNQVSPHRPPHIYQINTIYFITNKTYRDIPFFISEKRKNILQEVFFNLAEEYNLTIYAWVILSNHSHCEIGIGEVPNIGIAPVRARRECTLTGATPIINPKKIISQFFNRLHSVTALKLNREDKKPGRKIWYQYWDRCIRSEKDFYTRLNYIHHNPVKHGYVAKMENYPWSSYNHYLKEYGQPWLNTCFAQYPIIDFSPEQGME